jgi:flagellar biosynthesis/type III secretory pathway chaperone
MSVPRPTAAEARSQIVDIIDESVVQARSLNASLEDERRALEQQDTEALNAVVVSKNECAESLSALDRKRSALCLHWGFAAGPEQMAELVSWCDDDDAISERWAELMKVAARGNALNLTNGAIIRLRQQQFETSLSVLRGVTPGSDTYGRNGEESGDFSRRSLAEA